MRENLSPQDVTQELIDAVAAYLVLRTVAEVTREQVDAVQQQVLTDIPLYNDLEIEHGLDKERITEPSRAYLSQDENALSKYYEITDARLRELDIKPAEMQLDYCPALVAEYEQTKAEWTLIDEAAKMLGTYEEPGQFNAALLSTQNGLETRQRFIDLTVGLVLALQNPKQHIRTNSHAYAFRYDRGRGKGYEWRVWRPDRVPHHFGHYRTEAAARRSADRINAKLGIS